MQIKNPNSSDNLASVPPLLEPLSVPLCVDLDGTLIHEDTTREAFFTYCRVKPWRALRVAAWFLRGRHAYMKQQLARHVDISFHKWTFSQSVLSLLAAEQQRGRVIYLVSATDIKFALAVAQLPPCVRYFSPERVLASRGIINYRAQAKAELLLQHFGRINEKGNYIYVGNSHDDLAVWEHGQTPIVVSYTPDDPLVRKVKTQHLGAMILWEGGED